MYAELFPSAQRFISAVEEKVNVELRMISGATGPARWNFDSPRWMASVASDHLWAGFFMRFLYQGQREDATVAREGARAKLARGLCVVTWLLVYGDAIRK